MIRRNRLIILFTSAALGMGVVSGCEKVEGDDGAAAVETEDGAAESGADEGEAETPEPATDTTDDDSDAEVVDDSEDEQPPLDDAPEPDEIPNQIDDDGNPIDADDGEILYSVLPTDHCPIDIPAPFTPHAVDSEEPGDGTEIYCIVHVSSKGDPVYLEQDIAEQFRGHDAEQLQDTPAADPYDANDISIQSWLFQDHEVIVNMRYVGPTGVELTYVVRSPERTP